MGSLRLARESPSTQARLQLPRWTAKRCRVAAEDITQGRVEAERRASSTMTSRLVAGDGIFPGSPTAHELEEFFASAEQEQCMLFMEKYNFDVLTDTPLPGRFQWVRLSQ
ncbi:hypothetical protein SAY87_028455 [Trapa incisa]|uniref:Cyclin-dependent kinase inhibitor domain-containing protein n=1 Tax=Trapa incisa TaxID=236973 RepID=A0AAN7L243_9MYRT|nr:hypothetical protein SAY87_028455 [Trapa incisa]